MTIQEGQESSLRRIEEDDLDWVDDAKVFHGQLFTGVGFSEYQNGVLEHEYHYANGFRKGVCRKWFPNGVLKEEHHAYRGEAPDILTEWYVDGQKKSEKRWLYHIVLEHRRWNEDGELVESTELSNDDLEAHTFLDRMQHRED